MGAGSSNAEQTVEIQDNVTEEELPKFKDVAKKVSPSVVETEQKPKQKINETDPQSDNESLSEHSTNVSTDIVPPTKTTALVPAMPRVVPMDYESEPEETNTTGDGTHSPTYLDEFGFVITEQYEEVDESPKRLQKWEEMTMNWDVYVRTKGDKMKKRVRKGIPNVYRMVVWARLCKSELYKNKFNKRMTNGESYYKSLLTKAPDPKHLTIIHNDLDRTFPRHAMFSSRKGDGQNLLYNVLYAYACHDRTVGYCQGMGFLAALFLMYYTEEDAFYCLFACLNDTLYDMRGLYMEGFPSLRERFFQLDYLLKKECPKLHEKFHENGIDAIFYSQKWFMTNFIAGSKGFPNVLKVWDCFLSEGYKITFRVALALLKMKEKELENVEDYEGLMRGMQDTQLPDDILERAFEFRFSRRDLRKASEEYKKTLTPEQKEDRV